MSVQYCDCKVQMNLVDSDRIIRMEVNDVVTFTEHYIMSFVCPSCGKRMTKPCQYGVKYGVNNY